MFIGPLRPPADGGPRWTPLATRLRTPGGLVPYGDCATRYRCPASGDRTWSLLPGGIRAAIETRVKPVTPVSRECADHPRSAAGRGGAACGRALITADRLPRAGPLGTAAAPISSPRCLCRCP